MFFLFISCSGKLTNCILSLFTVKLLVTTSITVRWPTSNSSYAIPFLPVKSGSEVVNWGQEVTEGCWETRGGGYPWGMHQHTPVNPATSLLTTIPASTWTTSQCRSAGQHSIYFQPHIATARRVDPGAPGQWQEPPKKVKHDLPSMAASTYSQGGCVVLISHHMEDK